MTTPRRERQGWRRTIPAQLSEVQRERLRGLVHDPDTWVLRSAWDAYLLDGDPGRLVDPADLSTGHLVASLEWLRQQRHPLHRVLEGGRRAPEGWLESLPLHQRLTELLER